MKSITASTGLLYSLAQPSRKLRHKNEVNIWRELRRRWMIGGILCAMLMAVLAPRVGNPGGPLHTEHLSHIARWWIYFNAGVRVRGAGGAREWRHAGCVMLQARLVAPALAATVASLRLADTRVASGLITISLGGGSGWLSLGMQQSRDACLLVAIASDAILAVVTAPIANGLVCGHYTPPPLSSLLPHFTSPLPCVLGALYTRLQQPDPAYTHDRIRRTDRFCVLFLLYTECCGRLEAQGGGGVPVGDVVGCLVIVLLWLVSCGVSCSVLSLYSEDSERVILTCALPKTVDDGKQ